MTPQTIAHYRITGKLGQGGMGEVYRAADTKLGRDVAIKVLPENFALDVERMARFEREAKVLASLNHPNIAAIYGVEERALVMELVEGETLGGPLPLEKALDYALQIAGALAAAHEKGIVHRDLKPGNIKIKPNGTVKVLDFGLAKTAAMTGADANDSPTLITDLSQTGVILGTVAYMSPEQARGMTVDSRADIWAFGVVLYEMITGKQAFVGGTVSDTLAAVLKEEPDLSLVPPKARRLVRCCLQKDPKQRLQDISDARLLLEEVPVEVPIEVSKVHRWPWIAVAALLLLALATLGIIHFREPTPVAPALMKFEIPIPEQVRIAVTGTFELSPDGRRLVFAATGPDGVTRLWVRGMDFVDAKPLIGTESPTAGHPTFGWSPDGQSVIFDGGRKLRRIDLSTGISQVLADLPGVAVGASWSKNGVLIIGNSSGSLMRLPAEGGTPSPLTVLDPSRREINHTSPLFLPDGRHFLYGRSSTVPENAGVYVGSIDAKPEEQGLRKLIAGNTVPWYAPGEGSNPGWLLFHREGVLIAQQFDTNRIELLGEPVRLVESIGAFIGFGFFSVSQNGVLAYRSGGGNANSQLTWLDREGKTLGVAGALENYSALALAPDQLRAAASLIRPDRARMLLNLWQIDLVRGATSRLTFGQLPDGNPVWSADGKRIVFSAVPEGVLDLFESQVGAGDPRVLLKSKENKTPTSLSHDEKFLLYEVADDAVRRDLWLLPLEGARKPVQLTATDFNESQGRFATNTRWIAYTSDETGRSEIYVRSFSIKTDGNGALGAEKWVVSKDGGHSPHWRGDGKELFYIAPDGRMMAAAIAEDTVIRPGAPQPLFQTPRGFAAWDVAEDGRRFLFAVPQQPTQTPFTIVLNWPELLKK